MIFGREIDYNKQTHTIEIDPELYFDKNGKKGIEDPEELKFYIINIYKTILYRGIKGTFIYACNEGMREYLKQHITTYQKETPFRILPFNEIKPYVNAVPLVDISAAAGHFSDLQIVSDFQWVELPFNVAVRKGYFVCKVMGESMNQKIPNGSWCLFKKDEGGSRNGKIVLVEHYKIQDADFGAGYTVKLYESKKEIAEENWKHGSIVLKPMSDQAEYKDIFLTADELSRLTVVGVFVKVLS